jgi:threonine dehydratase
LLAVGRLAGLEFTEQVPELDMLILPIGGGGLCGGFAAAVKQTWPRCKVLGAIPEGAEGATTDRRGSADGAVYEQIYGVEPEGADTMHQSFEAGHACRIDKTTTIADSLAPPMATDTTYAVCRCGLVAGTHR